MSYHWLRTKIGHIIKLHIQVIHGGNEGNGDIKCSGKQKFPLSRSI